MNLPLVTMYLLFVFYCLVIVVRAFGAEKRHFTWPHIKVPALDMSFLPPCTIDDECMTDEKCYKHVDGIHRCVKTTTRECNPITGDLVLTKSTTTPLLKCVCKEPHLITQGTDGSNCDLDVACGIHGHLDTVTPTSMSALRCVCDQGYQFDQIGMNCVRNNEGDLADCHPFRAFPAGSQVACDCPSQNYVSSDSKEAREIFDNEYLAQFRGKGKCLRRPCRFDALNDGRELLAGATHVVDSHSNYCVCDPRHGLFGVTLKVGKYLRGGGNSYDACASIFAEGSKRESSVNMDVYCYFYIEGRTPVCFVHFRDLKNERLSDVFSAAKDSLVVTEEWGPNNFFQHVLKNRVTKTHCRECHQNGLIYHCNEHLWEHNLGPKCEDMRYLNIEHALWSKVQFYNSVYRFPFCQLDDRDPVYKDTFVLNPNMINDKRFPELLRSDGLVLHPWGIGDQEIWTVEYADSKFANWAHPGAPQLSLTGVPLLQAEVDFQSRVDTYGKSLY